MIQWRDEDFEDFAAFIDCLVEDLPKHKAARKMKMEAGR
jgi:hypothetical protein